MKKTLLLLAVFLLSFGFGSAQTSNEKLVLPTPSNMLISEGQFLVQTADGGYLLTGTTANFNTGNYAIPRLIKLAANLQVEWDKTYLEESPPHGMTATLYSPARQTADGGYAMAVANDSTTTDFLRLGVAGNILWEKDFGWCHSTRLLGVLPDGSFVISFNEIRRLDANGNMLPQPATIADADAILLSNNDVLTNFNNVNNKRVFRRTDLDGNIIWETPPMPGLYPVATPVAMPDGGFAVLAVNAQGLESRVHRYDALGIEIWISSATAIPATLISTSLSVTANSLFVLSGKTITNRGFVAQMNAAGDGLEWSAESPEDGQPHLKTLTAIPTPDGWAAGVGVTLDDKFGFLKVGVNSGIIVNTLRGRVAKDDDDNCVVDVSESGLNYARVRATNGAESFGCFTNATGQYQLILPSGDFTLGAQANEPFFSLCPATNTSVSFPPGVSGLAIRNMPMQSPDLIHEISGTLHLDQDNNCTADAGEPVLQNWKVEIHTSSGNLHLSTDANGLYKAFVPDGDYQVSAIPYNNHFSICAPATQTTTLTGPAPQTATLDFVANPEFFCARMRADLGISQLRPCTTSTVYAYYRNDGTTTASDASMVVTLDPLLTYVSALPAPASIDGSTLTFNLGDVAASPGTDWNAIKIRVTTDCGLAIGDQVCVSAKVYPDVDCTQGPGWNGAIVEASGECDANDQAIFRISNVGNAPNVQILDYVITEDQIVLIQGSFQLNPGEDFINTVPGHGLPLTLIAQQEPGYPGDTLVVWNIVNCGGSGSGMWSGFGGSSGPFTHQECFTVTNSLDPNDKDAIPQGHGPEHFVYPGTPLEYRIRFQNTGNDTAFLVVIRDTLSANFDFGKIEARGSSHPYQFAQISDSILQFTFENILLPDSTTNPEGSQGFVEFKVYPKPGLEDGTPVLNNAAIYFDFNEPVITNTVRRVYGKYAFVKTNEPAGKASLPVKVYPNPFITETTFEIPENAAPSAYRLTLHDETGRFLRHLTFDGNKCLLRRGDLPAGALTWSITADGTVVSGGTIVAY